MSLLVAMGNLFYRDVKYLFEVVLMVWMFGTSVLYPAQLVGGRVGMLMELNPLTPILDGYRAVLLVGQSPFTPAFRPRHPYFAGAGLRGVADVSPRRIPVRGERVTMKPAVVFDGVWKKFRRGERHDSLRDLIPSMARRVLGRVAHVRSRRVERVLGAEGGLVFEVAPGEALGIIGPNGAGKSTTLKLLTKILRPNRGRMRSARPRRRADRGCRRLSSRSHRPRKHLFAGRDHGHAPRRSGAEARYHHRICRRRATSSTRR